MVLTAKQIQKLKRARLVGRNKVPLAREMTGLSQIEVGAALGMPQSYVSDIERGEYVDLPLERSRAWARVFGVQVEDLFPAPTQKEALVS